MKNTEQVISWTLFEGGAEDNQPDKHNGTWEELSALLTYVNPRPSHPDPAEAKKLVPAFSETVFREGTTRGKDNSETIHLLVLDFDNCREVPTGEFHLDKRTGKPTTRPKLKKIPIDSPAKPEEVLEKLKAQGLAAVVWTTWSSSPALVKFRVVVPLANPIPSPLWEPASEWALDTLGLSAFRDSFAIDLPVLRDIARLNFLPCAPDPKTVQVWKLEGSPLDIPEAVLPTYEVREIVKESWQRPRRSDDTEDGKKWWTAYNVDFSTLDLVKLLEDMGVFVGPERTYRNKKTGKKGIKRRCHCLWPEEHSKLIDKDDAALIQIPGEWPSFWCEHTVHNGSVGLREICEAAGVERVAKFATAYLLTPKTEPVPALPSEPHPLRMDTPEGLTLHARELVAKHRGEGWTPASQSALIREALIFAGKLHRDFIPYLPALYWSELTAGGVVLSEEVMHEHTKTLREERAKAKHDQDTRLHLNEVTQEVRALVAEGKVQEARTFLLEETAILQARALEGSRPAPVVVIEEMDELRKRLDALRGRERVGLAQNELPDLDEALMGLRGLLLLAGPPGSGKTSLAVQLGLGALEADTSSAVLLISLEQSRWEHLTRNLAFFSELPWQVVATGSGAPPSGRFRPAGVYFEPDDQVKLELGEAKLREYGKRFLILDDTNFGDPTPELILHEVNNLKAKTGASKVLVIVDYLQLWPLSAEAHKNYRTDLDRDKWQIGQLKTLKNLLTASDAILAISEAKKEDWKTGLNMGSVMGSARGTYTPDVVMVLQPFSAAEYEPEDVASTKKPDEKAKEKAREEGERRLRALKTIGRAMTHLEIVKGRDGVDRRAFDLVFLHKELRFEQSSLGDELGKLL